MPTTPHTSLPRRALFGLSGVLLPAATLTLLASTPAGAAPTPAATPTQRQVIVQFSGTPALTFGHNLDAPIAEARRQADTSVAAAHRALVARDAQVLAAIKSRAAAHVTATYTYAFNGAALTIPSTDVTALAATPGVARVYPDATVTAAGTTTGTSASGDPQLDPALSLIRAPQVWSRHDPAGQPTDGRGEVIAVIDTGVDYTDADLGGGFGPGHKVLAGYDYVNGDADPMDDNGHGTHVAGIIAGAPARPGGITGVAPGAELTAYKVLDDGGYGNESTILEGLEAATSPTNPYRADVVNMSLGAHADASDPMEQAAATVAQSGVVVVAAAGNDGPGESSTTSPGEAPGVVSVGASFSGVDEPNFTVTAPVRRQLTTDLLLNSANPPASGETLPLADVGNGSPGSYDGLDVAGKAVVMSTPPLFDYDAYLADAAAHKVAAVILAPSDYFSTGTPPAGTLSVGPATGPRTAPPGGSIGGFPFVAITVDATTGTGLRELLAKGPVTLHVAPKDVTDEVAAFSSHGPAQDTYLNKPDLVAPGVDIRSTWPGSSYKLDTGTSMAAPHVAGAAALVLQDHPQWTGSDAASALTSAAHHLDRRAPTAVGAGRLDVATSDDATVLPSPWGANLGLASMGATHATGNGSVQLRNTGPKPAHVTLAVQHATGGGAPVTVTPQTLVIPRGGSQQVRVHAQGPARPSPYDVSGIIVATVRSGSTTSSVRVPYLMAVRPLRLHPTPDPTAGPQTIEIYSEAPLADPPTVAVTGPHHTTATATATWRHFHWWQAVLPDSGPAGTYTLTATARSSDGRRVTGRASFDRLGPLGSAHWSSVGPEGAAGALVTSPADPATGYLMPQESWESLLQRTTDGGQSWTPVGEGVLDGGADEAVAVDPTNARTVYVAQDGTLNSPFTGRVLVSHDAGNTWSTLLLPDTDYWDVAITSDGTTIAVLDVNGVVHYSTDHGRSWSTTTVPSNNVGQRLVFSGHDLYLPAGGDLWKLPNLGSGTDPTIVWTAPGQYPQVSAVAARDGAVAVAGYDLVRSAAPVTAVSADSGSTWQTADVPNAPDPVAGMSWAGEDLYGSSDTKAWRLGSDSTWAPVTGLPDSDDIKFAQLDGRIVATVRGFGVYQQADSEGSTFHRIGGTGTMVHALAITRAPDGSHRLLAGTLFGSYQTPVPEAAASPAVRDWGLNGNENSTDGDELALAVNPHNPRVVYALARTGFFGFSVEKSHDGGQTWRAVESPRTSAQPLQISVSPADPSYVYVTEADSDGYGVLVSTDAGQSWRRYDPRVPVTAVTADPRNPRVVWLGGPDGLYRSIDGGHTVNRAAGGDVTSIAVDPHNPRHLVVGGTTIRTSSDDGRTWHRAHTEPGRAQVTAIVHRGRNGLCASTGAFNDDAGLLVDGRGVWCSTDAGQTWHNVSGDLPLRSVTSLQISPDGRWLFAGTTGEGVYRTRARSMLP